MLYMCSSLNTGVKFRSPRTAKMVKMFMCMALSGMRLQTIHQILAKVWELLPPKKSQIMTLAHSKIIVPSLYSFVLLF
jgi:hypothetical protein